MQKVDNENILLKIKCLVYNHEKYIRKCLEGFVSQRTNFKFKAIVHDDFSTDNTAGIIKEYAEQYPDVIVPVFEQENLLSKHDFSLRRKMNSLTTGVKYIALCEGDDYWVDPFKLQKQVDFLENHPDYVMCCSDAYIITEKGDLDWARYEKDCDISAQDMVLGSGNHVPTASLLYRADILDDYPDCCEKCHVGDFPLQIFATLKGKVRYFSEKQVAYRFMFPGSWNSKRMEKGNLLKNMQSEVDMLNGLNMFSKFDYNYAFNLRLFIYVCENIHKYNDYKTDICNHFEHVINSPINDYFYQTVLWYKMNVDDEIAKEHFSYIILNAFEFILAEYISKGIYKDNKLFQSYDYLFQCQCTRTHLSTIYLIANNSYYTIEQWRSGYLAKRECYIFRKIREARVWFGSVRNCVSAYFNK